MAPSSPSHCVSPHHTKVHDTIIAGPHTAIARPVVKANGEIRDEGEGRKEDGIIVVNIMAKSISLSSSSSLAYDVFLSFRGKDTRKSFTGHLYNALCQKGIRTFMDDEELEKGAEITSALVNAIKKSKIAIVIFSENYASSTYCLDELVVILEQKDCKILPIFYLIDPSYVRHQIGSYGEALTKHETRIRDTEVKKWRSTLHQASNKVGWHLSQQGDKSEYKVIKEIVEKVHEIINQRNYSAQKYGNVQQVCGTECTVCGTALSKLGQHEQMLGNVQMKEYKSTPSVHTIISQTQPSIASSSVGFGAQSSPFSSQGIMSMNANMIQSYNPSSCSPMCMHDKLDYHDLNASFSHGLSLGLAPSALPNATHPSMPPSMHGYGFPWFPNAPRPPIPSPMNGFVGNFSVDDEVQTDASGRIISWSRTTTSYQ